MELLWDEHSSAVPALMQQMALYFIQFRPAVPGGTLYCTLGTAIAQLPNPSRVMLSTLNYECLLERSLTAAGLGVDYFDVPTQGDRACAVWKLHGSCNFMPTGIKATRGVSFTRDVLFGTGVLAAGDLNDAVAFCLGDNALPPVMCLYMRDKPVQVSPGSLKELQLRWRAQVADAECVVVVGVHPNPDDEHLWEALAETEAVVLYAGDRAAFDNWHTAYRRDRPSRFLGTTFEEALPTILSALEA